MTEKLKIAIYSGEIPSTTFIERLIGGLASHNCEVYLFGNLKRRMRYNSNNVVVKGYKQNRFLKAFFLLRYSMLLAIFRNKDKRKLDTILKKNVRFTLYDRVKCYPVLWHKPDVFHIQWAKGLEDWVWVKDFNIKLVLSLRGAHINYSPIADENLAHMYRSNFPYVDKFHAVSKAIAEEAETYNAKKENIKVVYSGLDLDTLEQAKAIKKTKSDVFQIISVGRPHWIKGYTYAIDACKILKDRGFDFMYKIVGGINLELKYQISELGLNDHIQVLNQLPFKEVQRLIQSSDVLLLPSTKEGLANVVLEAMAGRQLVLTSKCGGMEEVVDDGVNGFLMPIRNAEYMASKIIDISRISNEEKKRIVSNAFKTIEKRHTADKMINDMLELYHNL